MTDKTPGPEAKPELPKRTVDENGVIRVKLSERQLQDMRKEMSSIDQITGVLAELVAEVAEKRANKLADFWEGVSELLGDREAARSVRVNWITGEVTGTPKENTGECTDDEY